MVIPGVSWGWNEGALLASLLQHPQGIPLCAKF